MSRLLIVFSITLIPFTEALADRSINFNLPECGVKQHVELKENTTFTIKVGNGCNFTIDTTPIAQY